MIGVVTVAVVTAGIATVTVATGVLTVTVAGTVTDTAGRETVGTGSVERDVGVAPEVAGSAADEMTDGGDAAPPGPCVDAGVAADLSGRRKLRGAASSMGVPRGVRPAASAGPPAGTANAAACTGVPIGATSRAATIPVVARPAATTSAAEPFTTVTCGMPARLSQRHDPRPAAATPSA